MPRFGTAGEQIGYQVHGGPPGAPPILLLHGFTASSASFATNIEALAHEFTVVTVDLLGHGDSDAPEAVEPYGPGPAVARLTALIRHLGYHRVLLCGHSLGGALALRVALDAPGYVAGLVVINSNSAAGTPAWRETAAPGLAQLAARVRTEGTGFMRRTRLYPAASKRLPVEAREALVRDFKRLSPQGVAGTAEALTVPVNAYERLPELAVPALVVIGDRDREFVRSSAEFLDRLPPELTSWVTIEDAGHAANLEQPAQFEAALIDWATELGYLAEEAPPVVAPARSHRASNALTLVGGAMIVAGVVMVAGAFFAGRDGGATIPAAPLVLDDDNATSTPTPVESSAGVRTPGPEVTTATPTATVATAATAPTTETPAPTSTDAPPQPTATNAPPVVVDPTATPTETPTEEPTPEPTPAGPFAAISGPSASGVGETQSFVSVSAPGALSFDWSGCSSTLNPATCARVFDASGCHQVTLVVFYPNDPQAYTAIHNVAVGDAVCP